MNLPDMLREEGIYTLVRGDYPGEYRERDVSDELAALVEAADACVREVHGETWPRRAAYEAASAALVAKIGGSK